MTIHNLNHIHFVGCNGVSMKVLKALAFYHGYKVSGSDILLCGHDKKNVDGADLVVYTSAVPHDNIELVYAKAQNIPLMTRGEFLSEISQLYDLSVAVSGVHGKTTTTAMLSCALFDYNPTVHIGADCGDVSARIGGKDLFITEACEYKQSFLSLYPDISIILNIDLDHTDCYDSLQSMQNAFAKFINNTKKTVIIGKDELDSILDNPVIENFKNDVSKRFVTVGFDSVCDYYAQAVFADKSGRYSFFVYKGNQLLGKVKLSVAGRHNVYNALFAIAASTELGAPFDKIKEGLQRFLGAKRRLELLGYNKSTFNHKNSCAVFSDYAHHPSEIMMSIKTIKECGYKHITIVFEPHTYSRTKSFANDFAIALSQCDQVVLLPVFAARENPLAGGTSLIIADLLKEKGANIEYFELYKDAFEFLAKNTFDESVILFMGAGSIDSLAREFVENNKV